MVLLALWVQNDLRVKHERNEKHDLNDYLERTVEMV
jgi:hypothetical protein